MIYNHGFLYKYTLNASIKLASLFYVLPVSHALPLDAENISYITSAIQALARSALLASLGPPDAV